MGSCTNDFDCPGTLVCYVNLTWQQPGESFCDCSSWYGWKTNSNSNVDDLYEYVGNSSETQSDQQCNELDLQGLIYIGFAALFVLGNLSHLLVFCFDLRHFWKFRETRDSNNTTLTLFYSTACLICLGSYGIFLILTLLTPSGHNKKLGTSNEKFSEYSIGERVTSALGVGLAVLASMNVSLMWLEVSERIRNLRRSGTHKHVHKYRHVVYGFQMVFIASVLICLFLGQFVIIFALAFPFEVVLIVSYIRGRIKFAALLGGNNNAAVPGKKVSVENGQISAKKDEYSKLARKIRRTSNVVIVCLTIFASFMGAFSFMMFFDWRTYSNPDDKFSRVVLVLNIGIVIVSIWNLAIFWYARSTFLNRVSGIKTSSVKKSSVTGSPAGGSTFIANNGSYSPGYSSVRVAQHRVSDVNRTSFDVATDPDFAGLLEGSGPRISRPMTSSLPQKLEKEQLHSLANASGPPKPVLKGKQDIPSL